MEMLPTDALVSTIDTIVQILAERGDFIRDWDDKSKIVHRVKMIGRKVYILAPREPPDTEKADGKHAEQNQVG